MQFANLIPVLLPIMVAALYATIKYLENAAGPNPPAFDPVKFSGTMAIALALGVFLYFTQGSVPSVEMLFAMLQAYPELVGFAVMGMVAVMDILSKLIGRASVKVAVLSPIAPATSCATGTCTTGTAATGTTATPAPVEEWDGTVDLKTLPTFQEGYSPFEARIRIEAAPDEGEFAANEAAVDWGDGSPGTNIPLLWGNGEVTHIYTYKRADEHAAASRMFHPSVTARNSQGKTKRAIVTVYVFDPTYTGGGMPPLPV
jgi:hypothetical protein